MKCAAFFLGHFWKNKIPIEKWKKCKNVQICTNFHVCKNFPNKQTISKTPNTKSDHLWINTLSKYQVQRFSLRACCGTKAIFVLSRWPSLTTGGRGFEERCNKVSHGWLRLSVRRIMLDNWLQSSGGESSDCNWDQNKQPWPMSTGGQTRGYTDMTKLTKFMILQKLTKMTKFMILQKGGDEKIGFCLKTM